MRPLLHRKTTPVVMRYLVQWRGHTSAADEIEFSCLLRVHTPVEAVETQMVSAQSVNVYTGSACSPQEHERELFSGH
jgi:hypothetical protein